MAWGGGTYSGMHVHLHHKHAHRKTEPCIYCGGTSTTWANQGGCSDQRWGTTSNSGSALMPWCQHVEHYARACHGCHHKADRKRNQVRKVAKGWTWKKNIQT